MNATESFKSSIIGGLPFLILPVLFAASVAFALVTSVDPAALDENQPDLTPSLSDYAAEAMEVCGGPVVKTGPEVESSTVVVVKNDGTVADMDKEIVRNMMRAGVPVWPIAVCTA